MSPTDVHSLYQQMSDDGVSSPMMFKLATTLRAAFKEASQLSLINSNPAAAVKKPGGRRVKRVNLSEVWNVDEVRRFLKAASGHRFETLLTLALDSGMRQGELFALGWEDVDLVNGIVRVERSLARGKGGEAIVKSPKNESSRRRIRIAPGTLDTLVRHRSDQSQSASDIVFPGKGGGHLRRNDVRREAFSSVLKTSGVKPIRFHDLHHTAATLWLLGGVNIKAVAARLGHSSIQVTLDTYSHVLPEKEDQLIGDLSANTFWRDVPQMTHGSQYGSNPDSAGEL